MFLGLDDIELVTLVLPTEDIEAIIFGLHSLMVGFPKRKVLVPPEVRPGRHICEEHRMREWRMKKLWIE